jgi:D-inositol-3-phosphate glycosyltransferase
MNMVRRVAYLSMHTSPLVQPGTGDAGGMNVYVDQLARAMAAAGVSVEVFTRRDEADLPDRVTVVPGYSVHHVDAGPARHVPTERLVPHVRRFAEGVLEALGSLPPVDVVHTHYWLSGWAGLLVKQALEVPMANSFHTLGRIKNLTKRHDDPPESLLRIAAEEEVIAGSDCVVASTPIEADDLLAHYGARPEALCVSPPGVDHLRFRPGSKEVARRTLGSGPGACGRLRREGPGAEGCRCRPRGLRPGGDPAPRRHPGGGGWPVGPPRSPGDADDKVPGGPQSGTGDLLRALAAPDPGRRLPGGRRAPRPQPERILRSSRGGGSGMRNPGCGIRVGGLRFAVDDDSSGLLVEGWDPGDHADALLSILGDPERQS